MPGIIHGTNEISWDKALIGNSTSLESIQSLAQRATYNSVIFINCNRSLSLSISSMAYCPIICQGKGFALGFANV